MSRTLDAAVDLIDAGLLAAAHERLSIALTSARHIADGLLDAEIAETPMRCLSDQVVELLSELDVAKHAADAIRQADA